MTVNGSPITSPAGKPVIHIVDDDASFLQATSRLLKASGFVVRTFPSAADFFAQRDRDAKGCLVVDLQMPGMNGLELQEALARTSNISRGTTSTSCKTSASAPTRCIASPSTSRI